MSIKLLNRFLAIESSGGIILFLAAIVAMLWANSSLAYLHQQFIDASLFWINEGLMAIFFLLVGLELKRNFMEGNFSHLSQVVLPIIAALGGMFIPILIYSIFNYGTPGIHGWSTPVATDIAFALGVLSLFGRRVPLGLKLFLLTLAIFDDIGAIAIIAIFFSHKVSLFLLVESLGLLFILYLFNKLSVRDLLPYLLVGIWLWLSLLHSGIHPTIAGFLLGLMIPDDKRYSPLRKLERILHPWVAFLIMPLFALANAGFSFEGFSLGTLTSGIVLGISLGLFLGKQIGVFGCAWILIKTRFAQLPEKTTWIALYGVALLCGIGFTMSLFLGTLSFHNQSYLTEVRLGVLLGSSLSAIFGAAVLGVAFSRRKYKGVSIVD